MHRIARLDQRYVWHPFTQMRDWLRREPIVIVRGQGAMLEDAQGHRYLDANSSIWTNLHGHNHPQLNAALRRQLGRIAHCSALGLANEPASRLAEKLVQAVNAPFRQPATGNPSNRRQPPGIPTPSRNPELSKVFFSDDGSTAMEATLKLAYEYSRRTGRCRRPRFLSLGGGYHGDTLGAVALGHIDLFHQAWKGLLFKTDRVMAPHCYRCPFNRAKPERADAREYRRCHWECVERVETACARQRRRGEPYAGFVFEPLVQGAAGLIAQPQGWLARVARIVRSHGTLLIADEVLTGFGRATPAAGQRWFASHGEGVQPDLMALAKGLTGGYLPMAATLTTQAVFDAFLGEYDEFKTFFHGHSYTGNPLGAAAALANLELLSRPSTQRARQTVETTLRESLSDLWTLPNVGDIRQQGCVAGIELVRDWRTRRPFALREQAGIRVCETMARHGVLTRPIGNVIVLMPPYCATTAQVRRMVRALRKAVQEVLGSV
ncbi:MAG: aminotransferase class III-fold pyridoxal phosphate-dependent enzyme [Verrucomicrobia bacterium]|jgi:adenosylmethionine-8-amino-7-oxononanoate aminotransferase|nr:aminotransferase class III-fold pyridoxal phosphate-dependent enzyme [Verrucomicrobiota bacterium]